MPYLQIIDGDLVGVYANAQPGLKLDYVEKEISTKPTEYHVFSIEMLDWVEDDSRRKLYNVKVNTVKINAVLSEIERLKAKARDSIFVKDNVAANTQRLKDLLEYENKLDAIDLHENEITIPEIPI